VSLLQTTTRAGRRTSTYRAFLEGEVTQRPNLSIITEALSRACCSKIRRAA
jgi:choline dehydrogenase